MGGAVISQAAEYRPEKIKTLVYVAAYLLRNGESIAPIAQGDTASFLVPNIIFTEDMRYCTVRDEAVRESFFSDCSDEDVSWATSMLVSQTVAPFTTPVDISEENFGRVPRVYIECLRDRTISPSLQREMYTALPCQRVFSLDTNHSPFFSEPEKLVAYLISL